MGKRNKGGNKGNNKNNGKDTFTIDDKKIDTDSSDDKKTETNRQASYGYIDELLKEVAKELIEVNKPEKRGSLRSDFFSMMALVMLPSQEYEGENYANRLLEAPSPDKVDENDDGDEYRKKLFEKENCQIKNDSLSNRTIGTGPKEKQYEAIIKLAKIIVISNYIKNQSYGINGGEAEKTRRCIQIKHIAIQNFLALTYILNNTPGEYENYFSYGETEDEKGMRMLTIDVPGFQQVSVHFGMEADIPIFYLDGWAAQKIAHSIIEKKEKLEEITPEMKEKLIEGTKHLGIIPFYHGKVYEHHNRVPFIFEGKKLKEIKKVLGIEEGTSPKELTKTQYETIKAMGLNEREIHQLAVGLNLSKEEMTKLEEYIKEDIEEDKSLTEEKIRSTINELGLPKEDAIKNFTKLQYDTIKAMGLNKEEIGELEKQLGIEPDKKKEFEENCKPETTEREELSEEKMHQFAEALGLPTGERALDDITWKQCRYITAWKFNIEEYHKLAKETNVSIADIEQFFDEDINHKYVEPWIKDSYSELSDEEIKEIEKMMKQLSKGRDDK